MDCGKCVTNEPSAQRPPDRSRLVALGVISDVVPCAICSLNFVAFDFLAPWLTREVGAAAGGVGGDMVVLQAT